MFGRNQEQDVEQAPWAVKGEITGTLIKVAGTSRVSLVAGAIAGVMRDGHNAEVQAIGAIAVNQAMKSVILARSYLKEDGITLMAVPEFVDVDINGNVRTAIKIVVMRREIESGETETLQ